jgi:colanic acid/amylovoran biosynthesis protein
MVIQIDGVNTQNKGAELMLVAILEELEVRYPKSTIYINPDSSLDLSLLSDYNLNVRKRPGLQIGRIVNKVCYKLKLNHSFSFFKENYAPKNVDILLDASGFKYSDQWNWSFSKLSIKEGYYRKVKNNGTKIYFLTQAFGPFETDEGKKSVEILSANLDLIFAREEKSYEYLLKANADNKKVKISCDFTFKVSGEKPNRYQHLKGGVVIIPNKKMITHGGSKSDNYLKLFIGIIDFYKSKNETVFLLNHESEGDLSICKLINSKLTKPLEIVNNLKAKEVKGVIGNSKITISSRFHGVASSLSQGVPCLATSWNHKYEMLFKNFNQKDCVINSSNSLEENIKKIASVYDNLPEIKKIIKKEKPRLLKEIDLMWNIIFEDFEKGQK